MFANVYEIDIIILSVILIVGVPINLYGAYVLWLKGQRLPKWMKYINELFSRQSDTGVVVQERRHVRNLLSLKLRLVQKHRSIADAIIIFIRLPFAISLYVLKYEWVLGSNWFGDAACKIYRFLNVFGFCLVSNLLVSIAVIRFGGTLRIQALSNGMSALRALLFGSWFGAVLSAAPFPFIFKANTIEGYNNNSFVMCENKWMFQSMSGIAVNQLDIMIFEWFHLLTVFWIPATVIFVLYSTIVCYIWRRGRTNTATAKDRSPMLPKNATAQPDLLRAHKPRNVQSQVSRMRGQVLQTSSLLVIIYWSCWLPYNLLGLLSLFEVQFPRPLNYFEHLIVFNSAVNPLLYRFGDKPGRDSQNHTAHHGTQIEVGGGRAKEVTQPVSVAKRSTSRPSNRVTSGFGLGIEEIGKISDTML